MRRIPRLLTKQDLMTRWQVCARTVDRIVKRHQRGGLKPTKFSRRTVRWTLAQVEIFEHRAVR